MQCSESRPQCLPLKSSHLKKNYIYIYIKEKGKKGEAVVMNWTACCKLHHASVLESISAASNDTAPAAGICSVKEEEEKENGCWPFLFSNLHGLKKEESLVGFDLDGFGSCKLLTACCRVCATRYFQFRWNLMLKKTQPHETRTKIRQRDRRLLQMTFSWLMPACSIGGVLRSWIRHLGNLEKATVNDTEMLFFTLNGKESAFFQTLDYIRVYLLSVLR